MYLLYIISSDILTIFVHTEVSYISVIWWQLLTHTQLPINLPSITLAKVSWSQPTRISLNKLVSGGEMMLDSLPALCLQVTGPLLLLLMVIIATVAAAVTKIVVVIVPSLPPPPPIPLHTYSQCTHIYSRLLSGARSNSAIHKLCELQNIGSPLFT